jgi:hypothetical protein
MVPRKYMLNTASGSAGFADILFGNLILDGSKALYKL